MTEVAAQQSRPVVVRRQRAGTARPLLVIGASVAALVAIGFLSLMWGAVNLTPHQVWTGLTSDSDVFTRSVVWEIRWPRMVDGMLVGAALGVAGCLLQGVTRNPLADPTLFGITAASALASTAVLTVDPNLPQWAIMLACAGGGLVGAGVLFFIAWRGAVSPVRLALAGVALSAFFGAAIVGLLSSSRVYLQTSVGFLAGGLYGADWPDLWAMLPYVGVGLVAAFLSAGRLNALALGDDIAAGLGVLTDRTRLGVLAVCGILTGAAVSAGGLVSFVGLVCPHLARFAAGRDNRYLVPVSALFGGILVTAADLFARVVISPTEIPMGIVTAGIGAPFLLWLVKFKA